MNTSTPSLLGLNSAMSGHLVPEDLTSPSERLQTLLLKLNISHGLNVTPEQLEEIMNYHSKNISTSHLVPTGMVIFLSIVYGLISLVAVIGNAIVIWIVVSCRNMHSVTNYFISNLALADIIIGLFSIPFQVS